MGKSENYILFGGRYLTLAKDHSVLRIKTCFLGIIESFGTKFLMKTHG